MKTIMAFVLVLLVSCKGVDQEKIRDFIPGVYVRAIHHEFAEGSDTIIISWVKGNSYLIQKRAGFQRIRKDGGQQLPVIYRSENWTGVYDEKEGLIREQQKGKILSFQPEENRLLLGGSPYQKLKP
jgi:hypothetical protein